MKFPGAALIGDSFRDRIVAGVRISGAEGSLETGTRGRLLTIADTSAISVESTSWVSCRVHISANIALRKFLEMPIILSHTPPAWEA